MKSKCNARYRRNWEKERRLRRQKHAGYMALFDKTSEAELAEIKGANRPDVLMQLENTIRYATRKLWATIDH